MPSAALRFTIATLILAAVWRLGLSRPTPTRKRVPYMVLAGLFNGVGYSLVYRAEESLPGGLAAVLFGTFPLFTAFLATVTRTERVAAHQLVGALIALGGIALIFSDRLTVSTEQAAGVVMLLCAVFCSASYGVILKRHASDINPLATTAIFLAVTAISIWLMAPFFGPVAIPWPPPAKPSIALLYLAIFGSVLAFVSYFYLLRRVSLMTTTTLVFVQPLIAVAVDAAFEREVVLSARTYQGMAIVGVGVLASVAAREYSNRRRREAEKALKRKDDAQQADAADRPEGR